MTAPSDDDRFDALLNRLNAEERDADLEAERVEKAREDAARRFVRHLFHADENTKAPAIAGAPSPAQNEELHDQQHAAVRTFTRALFNPKEN